MDELKTDLNQSKLSWIFFIFIVIKTILCEINKEDIKV